MESSHWSCKVLIADINIWHAKYINNQHTTVSSPFFLWTLKMPKQRPAEYFGCEETWKTHCGRYASTHLVVRSKVSFLCQPGKTLNLSFHTKFLYKLSYNLIQIIRFPDIFKCKVNPTMQTICKHCYRCITYISLPDDQRAFL